MPVICIGPVCIPITAILPVILFIFRPIYNRLPESYQKNIDKTVNYYQIKMNQFLRKIGWLKPKNEDKKTDKITKDDNISNTNNNNNNESNNDIIKELNNEDEWESLIEDSKRNNKTFIAYFTASYVIILIQVRYDMICYIII